MKVEVVTPGDYLGDVIGDINRRRGSIQDQLGAARTSRSWPRCRCPEMFGYINQLRAMSLVVPRKYDGVLALRPGAAQCRGQGHREASKKPTAAGASPARPAGEGRERRFAPLRPCGADRPGGSHARTRAAERGGDEDARWNPVADGDFVRNLDRINTLAEQSPGFVWRLQGNGGDATAFPPARRARARQSRPGPDVGSLSAHVYRSAHVEIMRRRREWFERMSSVPPWCSGGTAGHRPVGEAVARLERLRDAGTRAAAFTFAQALRPAGFDGGREVPFVSTTAARPDDHTSSEAVGLERIGRGSLSRMNTGTPAAAPERHVSVTYVVMVAVAMVD